jgi:homoserine dehydrogenase
MRIAVLGFGVVGQAVVRRLVTAAGPLQLTHVFNRRIAAKRVDWVPGTVIWTESFEEILAARPDVVVEVMGGRTPAGDYLRAAIAAGCHVVTANKQLMAYEGPELLALAAEHGVRLGYEASVAGGIPVLCAIREGLSGDDIQEVSGILNGTSNFVLTRMAEAGLAFEEVIVEARTLGYAEADPSDDVDGHDARAKLCILVRDALGFDVRPADVHTESIRAIKPVDFTYAAHLRCVVRQVARAVRHEDGVLAWVRTALVPVTSPLARVTGGQNIVILRGASGGETALAGFGAGGGPTAVAVVSDVLSMAAGSTLSSPGGRALKPARVMSTARGAFYLRFIVRDRPGVLAGITSLLAANGVNVDAVLQEPGLPKDALPFVVTLEETEAESVSAAVEQISRLDFHVVPPLALPIVG